MHIAPALSSYRPQEYRNIRNIPSLPRPGCAVATFRRAIANTQASMSVLGASTTDAAMSQEEFRRGMSRDALVSEHLVKRPDHFLRCVETSATATAAAFYPSSPSPRSPAGSRRNSHAGQQSETSAFSFALPPFLFGPVALPAPGMYLPVWSSAPVPAHVQAIWDECPK